MNNTRRIETPGGIFTVHVEGNGHRLLNLHGLTGFGQKSRESSPSGFQVATYDQRGHGNGPRLQGPDDYTIGAFVDDALAVLDALEWDRVSLAGQSMGAAVALRLALDHPDRVDRLILTAPAFGRVVNPGAARLNVMADNLSQSTGVDETIALMRQRLEDEGMPIDASAFLESFRDHHFASLAAAVRQVHVWAPFGDLDSAADLGVPAVVLGWPDDALHPFALAEEVATVLSAELGQVGNVFVALSDPAAIGRALDELLGVQ